MDFNLFGVVDLKLGYLDLLDLSVAIADATVTTMTVGTGQGALFATASATNPVEVRIDNEAIDVTGRVGTSDVVNIARARRGTTGAAHSIGTGNVKAILEVDMPYVNAFSMDPNINEIEFTGDGTSSTVPVSERISGEMGFGRFTTEFLDKIAAAAAVVAASGLLPAGVTERFYPQGGTYPFVRIRCTLKATRLDTGADARVRVEIPKAKVQNPFTFSDAGNNEAMDNTIVYSSEPGTTDLAGNPLPSVPTEGVHYLYDILAA